MTDISNREKALAYGVELAKVRFDTSAVLLATEFLAFLEPQPAGDVPATTPAASEPAKKRGRPSTAERPAPTTAAAEPAPTVAAPTAAVTAVADFLDEEPAKSAAPAREYTKEEVRNGLVAYGNLTSQAKAREVMETHGKSTTVSGIAKENYTAVVIATKKAYDAAGGTAEAWEKAKAPVVP